MTRRRTIAHRRVEFIPKELEEGVLYVSELFRTASHLCCCGCGGRVVTPLNAAKWRLTDHGDSVTLSPSIGLGTFACRSHYWIKRGVVEWCPDMTPAQTQRARRLDERASRLHAGERITALGRWWTRLLSWLGLTDR